MANAEEEKGHDAYSLFIRWIVDHILFLQMRFSSYYIVEDGVNHCSIQPADSSAVQENDFSPGSMFYVLCSILILILILGRNSIEVGFQSLPLSI